MITNNKKMQSQLIRQKILDVCSKETMLLNDIALAVGVDRNKINHHLLCLVNEQYLIKHHNFAIVKRANANGYSTAKTPYIWAYNITVERPPETKPQPFLLQDVGLMIKMGYTNITPIKGRVHQGALSAHGQGME